MQKALTGINVGIIEVQLNTIGQARFYTKHIKLLRTSNYTIKTCHNNIMMVDTCCKSIIRDCGSNLYVGMRVIDSTIGKGERTS